MMRECNGKKRPEHFDCSSIEAALAEVERLRTSNSVLAALRVLQGLSCHGDPRVTYEQAKVLIAGGRFWEAHRLFRRLEMSSFRPPDFYRATAWSYLYAGNPERAEYLIRHSLDSADDDWRTHFVLGEILRARDPIAAKAAFAEALRRSPDNIECLLNICVCDLSRGEARSAEEYARQALRVSPSNSAAWANLGAALLQQERLREAHDAFIEGERTELVNDDNPRGLDRGIALRLSGNLEAAIDFYEMNLCNHPTASAHAQYALCLLGKGRFKEGFDQFEFRWLDGPLLAERATYDRPLWSGQNLEGKTILVRTEQGAGDVLQFIRYLPLLKARGARVILELHRHFGALNGAFSAADLTVWRGDVLPSFDFYADLMGLPRAFGTTEQTIPADVPYIDPPEERSLAWAHRLRRIPGVKIGFVWAGDGSHPRDHQRSIDVRVLAQLFDVEGTTWISLQKGRSITAASADFRSEVLDAGLELQDFGDTAAILENLDLLITVDTSVAHLAGAMAKRAWVLLPFSCDWRWLDGRDDSPWYPTVRLFRQSQIGAWDQVIQRVGQALCDLVAYSADLQGTKSRNRTTNTLGQARKTYGARLDPQTALSRARRTRFGTMQCCPSIDVMSRSLEYYGQFLPTQLSMCRRIVRAGDILLEAGSGAGGHAIALASLVAPEDGQVLAVERSRILRAALQQNLAANNVSGVTVMPNSMVNCNLDDLCVHKLDVLKIVNQEYASDMLSGGEETLWRHRPAIISTHSTLESTREQADQLGDRGYRSWYVEEYLFDDANFNCRDDDIFFGARVFTLLAVAEEQSAPNWQSEAVKPLQ